MDSVRAPIAWWERVERRALPEGTSTLLHLLLFVALLVVVIWDSARDVQYLLTIPIDDIRAYECYARGFWRGAQALKDAPQTRFCGDPQYRFWIAPPRTFHTMPLEYPAPALVIFSLPLLWPFAPYNITYMWEMALVTLGVTAWLAARRLMLCAAAFALYMVFGGWATTFSRYDLAPGLALLAACILAERRDYLPAYLALAVGTLLKFSPAVLVPMLVIHQWRATGRVPRRDLAVYALVVVAGFLPGALIDPAAFTNPLRYNTARPPQIESLAGSVLWLTGRVGGNVHMRFSYHSLNVVGTFDGLATGLATMCLLLGLALVCWRAWQGRDTIGRSFILAVLVTLCGSKVLSPQYLAWLFPLVAYVEGFRLRWGLLALLTVTIYPIAYGFGTRLETLPDHPIFMSSILARNAVLLATTLCYLHPFALAREARARYLEHRSSLVPRAVST